MTFLDERIERTKEMILVYEDALLALGNNAVQNYSLNTGQTTIYVTRLHLPWLLKTVQELENRMVVLQARKTGCGNVNVIPGW